MYFVGREQEIRDVTASLSGERNIVVVGPIGIGRTSLIRQVARQMAGQWKFHFVDFSGTPGDASRALARALWPAGRMAAASARLGHADRNFRISHRGSRRTIRVIVMEDIASLTGPMIRFIRSLAVAASRFRLVAIVERTLPPDSLRALRGFLWPSDLIRLPALNRKASMGLIKHLSDRHGLGWTDDMVRMAAASTFGYPSCIHEIVQRAIRDRISSSSEDVRK